MIVYVIDHDTKQLNTVDLQATQLYAEYALDIGRASGSKEVTVMSWKSDAYHVHRFGNGISPCAMDTAQRDVLWNAIQRALPETPRTLRDKLLKRNIVRVTCEFCQALGGDIHLDSILVYYRADEIPYYLADHEAELEAFFRPFISDTNVFEWDLLTGEVTGTEWQEVDVMRYTRTPRVFPERLFVFRESNLDADVADSA